MIKRLLWGVVGLCVLVLMFNFIPIGSAQSFEYVNATRSENNSSSQLVMSYYQLIDENGDFNDPYVGTLRGAIVDVATSIAYNWGNGGYNALHTTSKIFYEGASGSSRTAHCHYVYTDGHMCRTKEVFGHYGSYEEMRAEYDAVKAGVADAHMHGSCCAFATFCQRFVWLEAPFALGTSNYRTVVARESGQDIELQDVSVIKEKAKPGDIIQTSGHTMLWVGEWTAPDGYEFHNAIAEMSWDEGNADCRVLEVDNKSATQFYLIPLATVIKTYAANGPAFADGFSGLEVDITDES